MGSIEGLAFNLKIFIETIFYLTYITAPRLLTNASHNRPKLCNSAESCVKNRRRSRVKHSAIPYDRLNSEWLINILFSGFWPTWFRPQLNSTLLQCSNQFHWKEFARLAGDLHRHADINNKKNTVLKVYDEVSGSIFSPRVCCGEFEQLKLWFFSEFSWLLRAFVLFSFIKFWMSETIVDVKVRTRSGNSFQLLFKGFRLVWEFCLRQRLILI